jgi:hypothetical protein
MREVLLIAAVVALGTFFMVSPRVFPDLLNWITQITR